MSSKTAESMTWHHDQRTGDGLLRHPADYLAWKSFNSKFPSFASDPRSVRLGLASDGFNPYKIMGTSYSTWLVVLVPYNLLPRLCMKQSSFILSMIIPREKVNMGIWCDLHLQVPPNRKYWLSPSVFAMSKEEKEVFCMVLKDIKVPDAFLYKLKSYCHNKRYPKGSIAEGYLAEEYEPYVFSSQVKQVFYSKDSTDEGWYIVLQNTPGDLFDMSNGSKEKMPRKRLQNLSILQNNPNSKETNSEQQTAFGSSNVPETPDEPAEIQTKSGGTRRGRGRTLLKDLNELNPVERVKVSRNSFGQPVGSEAQLLTGYLGIIARNAIILPINYESWHQISDSNKNQALDNIKERFPLEVSATYVKKALGKKWREIVSLEEKFEMTMSELEQAREKQKFTHTVGSKSFACVVEAEERSSSKKVGHFQLFDITHRKKDGSPMTSEAEEIMEKLKDKKAEYEAIALRDSSVNLEDIDNKIITEVLGLESSLQYMPSGSQAQAEVQRLRDQIAQMQAGIVEQIAQLRAKVVAREAEAAAREVE
ncbi:hypothetical protein PVK06_044653 [Gossypium arboreum]|uniref:Uncharacterized protein n=1 Tax=Gossypium arboreum TaxID=29729 RepID=A0ABR0MSA4_GOSAR|nr:hypothetical protein PVK06_044653 [Gossypium arboreum]